jgi:hypothetical protein
MVEASGRRKNGAADGVSKDGEGKSGLCFIHIQQLPRILTISSPYSSAGWSILE